MAATEKKTIIITGGTGGIGFQTANALALLGHQIVITGRNSGRAKESADSIAGASENPDIHFLVADLNQRKEVERLGNELLAQYPRIDVLINNAGHLADRFEINADGFETNFAVNVVAPYVLTQRLLPSLEKAAPARVINVTGGAPFGKLVPKNLHSEKGFVALENYTHSKRAMEAMSVAQAGELESKNVFLNVVYPGGAATSMTGKMTSGHLPWMMRPLWPLFAVFMQKDDGGKSAQKASRSSVWAATSEELTRVAGNYYDTNCKQQKFHSTVLDSNHQKEVLELIQQRAAHLQGA